MLAMLALQKESDDFVGFTATSTPSFNKAENTQIIYTDMLMQVAQSLNRLNNHLDNGIKAGTKIGDETIVKFDDRNNYLKSIIDDVK